MLFWSAGKRHEKGTISLPSLICPHIAVSVFSVHASFPSGPCIQSGMFLADDPNFAILMNVIHVRFSLIFDGFAAYPEIVIFPPLSSSYGSLSAFIS